MTLTLKDRIIIELARAVSLDYESLEHRLEANQPSLRRAAMQLYREGRIHYHRYEPVEWALGRTNAQTITERYYRDMYGR